MHIRRRSKDAKHEWAYVVELVTVTRGDDILVRTHADLLALRCHVAPYLLLEALMQLGDLRAIATKAFRAAHGHSVQRACNECDPEQVKQDEEFRRRQAKLKAEQAKAGQAKPKPSKKLN